MLPSCQLTSASPFPELMHRTGPLSICPPNKKAVRPMSLTATLPSVVPLPTSAEAASRELGEEATATDQRTAALPRVTRCSQVRSSCTLLVTELVAVEPYPAECQKRKYARRRCALPKDTRRSVYDLDQWRVSCRIDTSAVPSEIVLFLKLISFVRAGGSAMATNTENCPRSPKSM